MSKLSCLQFFSHFHRALGSTETRIMSFLEQLEQKKNPLGQRASCFEMKQSVSNLFLLVLLVSFFEGRAQPLQCFFVNSM